MVRVRNAVHASSSFRSSIERALTALYQRKTDIDELIGYLEAHPPCVKGARRRLQRKDIELSAQLRTIHLKRIRDAVNLQTAFLLTDG
jgi:DNA primase large subunit